MQISRFTSSKPSKFAFASDEKSIRRPTTSFVRRCLRRFPALPPRMRREARYCLKPRKGDCLRLTVRSGGSPPFSLSRVPRPVSTRRAQRPRAENRAHVSRPARAHRDQRPRRDLRPRAATCVRAPRPAFARREPCPRAATSARVPRPASARREPCPRIANRARAPRPAPASRDQRPRTANCARAPRIVPAFRELRLRAANCVRELCFVFVRCTMYPRVVNRELCDAL